MTKVSQFNLLVSAIILLFCAWAVLANTLVLHYDPATYLPIDTLIITLFMLSLMLLGCHIAEWQVAYDYLKRLTQVFAMLSLILSLTQVVQLTPFGPIDHRLIKVDRFLGINTPALLNWITAHPLLHHVLFTAYHGLNYEIFISMLALIWVKDNRWRQRFFGLYLLTALIGLVFYYLFPTTAPADNFNSPFFNIDQRYTATKFYLVHAGIKPTFIIGGMAAMPSFHAIWTVICQIQCARWPTIARQIFIWHCLLLFACVALGWHYFVDIVGGVIVVYLAWRIINYLDAQSLQTNNDVSLQWIAKTQLLS